MKTLVLSASAAHITHLIFEWLAIAIGVQVYRWQRKRSGQAGILQTGQYAVFIGCIVGAGIGNKLVFWLEFPQLWSQLAGDLNVWASGQSIVGGLLGGLIGVELAKKLCGLHASTGDLFVLPLIVGTVIGRIGCFLAGLYDGTYGTPSNLPWAVDFGDGILRHPTQLYEMVFVVLWGGGLWSLRGRCNALDQRSGLLFKFYLAGYLLWRLFVDAIKPLPYDVGFGLSGIRWVCLVALLLYLPLLLRQWFGDPPVLTK